MSIDDFDTDDEWEDEEEEEREDDEVDEEEEGVGDYVFDEDGHPVYREDASGPGWFEADGTPYQPDVDGW